MFSRPQIGIIALVSGATFLMGLTPTQARKKPKATPAPIPTATPVLTAKERDAENIYEAVLLAAWIPRDRKIYGTLAGEVPSTPFIERMGHQHILLWNVRVPLTINHSVTYPQINVNKPTWRSDSEVNVYWDDGVQGSGLT